jgi:excisionase family DNA binding protein
MITVKEAAERLHLAPDECRRWIHAGVLPGIKVGSRWMVEEADLSRAAEHAKEYGIAANWLETFGKLTDNMAQTQQACDQGQ